MTVTFTAPRPGAARSLDPRTEERAEIDGWDDLCARHAPTTPAVLLCALVAAALDRYGVPASVLLHGDPAPGARALDHLRERGADARWDELLDTLGAPDGTAPGVAGGAPRLTPHDGGVTVSVANPSTAAGGPSADLHLDPDATGVRLVGDPAVVPDVTVRRLVGHLRTLVHAVLDGTTPLGRVDVLTPAERVLNGGTPERLPDYPGVTLHELFRLQAWRTPDAPALVGDHLTLTYRDLDHASNVLAARLVAEGVAPGDPVALCSERCVELFVGIIAVLKAGGVFVHLDPDLPAARLAQLADVSGTTLVVTGFGVPPLPTVPQTIDLPSSEALAAEPPVPSPDVLVGPHSPAYILFTSGSTGVPKAVLRSHRLHTSRVFLEQATYRLTPRDRHLLKLSISARELFWPLTTGGACVVVPPGGERDDQQLLRSMRAHDVSVLSIVPSMLRVLAASPAFADLPALRHVFVGGEALHRDLESQVRACGYEVHTTFTLTEADYVTHRGGPVPAGRGDDEVDVGVPLDMRVYVCDDHGRRVPPGVVGEVWTGGPGLSEGYLGDPERTAERFVPNPFGDPRAPVLFRSGDLARIRDDGSFEYCGRRDLQVKVRGQRVEPTEVEHWVRSHPAVDDAAVVGYSDVEQGAFLVGFVAATGAPPGERELRAFLAERVPGWMVPRHLTFVPRLPQMASGKVDRVALRLPQRVRSGALPPPAPAEDALQETLLGVWRRVLQIEDIGVDDDFVEVGGDSLRVLLLRAAIQDETGTAVDAAALLGAPTVRAQARLLAPPPAPGDGQDHVPPATTRARPATDRAAQERERRAALRRAAADKDGAAR